jgi:hypothetical protein
MATGDELQIDEGATTMGIAEAILGPSTIINSASYSRWSHALGIFLDDGSNFNEVTGQTNYDVRFLEISLKPTAKYITMQINASNQHGNATLLNDSTTDDFNTEMNGVIVTLNLPWDQHQIVFFEERATENYLSARPVVNDLDAWVQDEVSTLLPKIGYGPATRLPLRAYEAQAMLT